ncbi:ATP-binding region ATPase domain protein [Planoprotostelium fungivorum]|uniref:ATP-binding region ATPase domain protein n=1 Tax=Planoprotostelium fungivorum TaxID=1890364 RepID=A0A2P6NQE1_9EUKA|nr:ATP-binding region ATPase domain protein [Planoprotostelium fungivorum]
MSGGDIIVIATASATLACQQFAHYTNERIESRSYIRETPASSCEVLEDYDGDKTKYEKELEVGLACSGLSGVIQYYGTEQINGNHSLIMEDFGGMSLSSLLDKKQSFSMVEIVRLGLSILEAIRQIHERGYVHQMLCPEHILVHRSANQVKLCDLSFSSSLQKQSQVVINSKPFIKYLEWVSPEQTGRMNKDIDYRTDYYTFGTVMYRLCAGRPPFQSTTPSKLVYAHIAMVPEPPDTIVTQVPKMLSQIILKLLSKNADDRYQSVFGIRFDLERCLEDLASGTFREFSVGSADVRSRFQVAQRLYGRERETEILLKAFDRVTKGESVNHLALVSGYSGVGKTSIINEIYKPLTKTCGNFISGKIDQFNKGLPFSSVCQAFQQILKTIIAEKDEILKYWRENITNALGGRGQVIIDVIPEVETLIGSQPPLIALGPTENQARFKSTFIEFIKAFTRPEHPLVIFLDDLQWADLSTLTLIEDLMSNDDVSHLFLIGAYRDNEVEENHPLNRVIKSIKKTKSVTSITLSGLGHIHIARLVADSLQRNVDEVTDIANLIMRKTAGNPFFVTATLTTLVEKKHIHFNSATGKWMWDAMNSINITDDVIVMMTEKIQKLDPETQRCLSMAAAIGNRFDLKTLANIMQDTIDRTASRIWSAVKHELLLLFGDESSVAYSNATLRKDAHRVRFQFPHDRIQQAAYELTPKVDRPQIHHHIGWTLLQVIPQDQLDSVSQEKLFDILSHFGLSSDLIKDRKDKITLAGLWVKAAQRAKGSSAIQSAYDYACLAVKMLDEDSWNDHYSLTLAAHKVKVEMEYTRGEFQKAEELYPEIFRRCANREDKASVYQIRFMHLEMEERSHDALDNIANCLAMYDIYFPSPKIPLEEITNLLSAECQQTNTILAGRKISDLYSLPDVKEAWQEIIVEMVVNCWATTYITGIKEYIALVSAMAFNLTLRYGFNKYSSTALCNYSFSHSTYSRYLDFGPQFYFDVAVLGCHLLETHPNERLRARCYFPFAVGINQLVRSLNDAFPLLDIGYTSAIDNGNRAYASYMGHHIVAHRYFRGTKLGEVNQLIREKFPYMERYGRVSWCYGLGCATPVRYHLCDDSMPFEKWQEIEEASLTINQGSYFVGAFQVDMWKSDRDYVRVFERLEKALENSDGVTGFYSECEFYFCVAIVLLRAKEDKYLDSLPEEQRKRYEGLIDHSFELFERISVTCPYNNEHKLYLLRAQRARQQGELIQATVFYNEAKISASAHGFIQYEALSNELCGQLWLTLKQLDYAKPHLDEAFRLYNLWGSDAKVMSMSKDYGKYLTAFSEVYSDAEKKKEEGKRKKIKNSRDRVDLSPVIQNLEIVDVQTMMKISEAISQEMSLDQMLEKMMSLLMENAAACRGLFLVEEADELLMVAESQAGETVVDTLHATPVQLKEGYPQNVILHVSHTRETVIIGNSKDASAFESEEFIEKHQPRSILCTPVLRHNKLKGIIYLDNNLTESVFNSHRIKVIHVIAAQMATHLDNAKYTQLMDSEMRHRGMSTQLIGVKKGMEEFIDVLCHELRNPLNGIYGSTHFLSEQIKDFLSLLQKMKDPIRTKHLMERIVEINDLLTDISSSSDQLKDIVDTVLTASMLERGTPQLQQIHFKPLDIIDKVISMHSSRMSDKGLSYEVIGSDPTLEVIGDSQRLSQALVAIVSNSVKFMDHGKLTVQWKSEEISDLRVRLNLAITDTGIGMSETEVSKLFQQSTPGQTSLFSKYGSTSGLGLKLTKEIIESMEGNIYIKSQKGVGSTVYFSVLCDTVQKKKEEEDKMPPEKRRKLNHSKRVLIVEDNMINQKMLKRMLETEGCIVEVADNGQQALEKTKSAYASAQPFCVIFMDMEMPIMNGLESTKKIREFEVLHHCKHSVIVGLSANAREGHTQAALTAGMNHYITKPFKKNDIVSAIE